MKDNKKDGSIDEKKDNKGIVSENISSQMERSFLDYAMSVIPNVLCLMLGMV